MTTYKMKAIHTEEEHEAVMHEADRLLAAMPEEGTAAYNRLEVLGILISAYEREHPDHRIDLSVVNPIAAIAFHLERSGKTKKDLEKILNCTRSRVHEIMNGKRTLSLSQIMALVHELGIPADRLIPAPRKSSRPPPKKVAKSKPSARHERPSVPPAE
jgi:HTH-type transcriptional regulator/antitoxin HigA